MSESLGGGGGGGGNCPPRSPSVYGPGCFDGWLPTPTSDKGHSAKVCAKNISMKD